MRILMISAFYPPSVVGGWEQLVQDINRGLCARGHSTCVLTAAHGLPDGYTPADDDPGVLRRLTLESDVQFYRPTDFLGYRRRLERNLAQTRAAIKEFQPDVVFVHIMWNLNHAIPWLAEQMLPGRVVYYMADHWPYVPDAHTAYWRDGARDVVRRTVKRMVAAAPLRMVEQDRRRHQLAFDHVWCVSEAIRTALLANTSIPADHLKVIYNGVELDAFPFQPRPRSAEDRTLRLLYAGSLVPHKGVQTAVNALVELARQDQLQGLSLTIVGSGRPDYEAQLRATVADNGLDGRVCFVGRVPRSAMPAQLAQHDVLIFPSEWPEPLARMTQEAMAVGDVVIGTLTGGTGEILVEGETGLTFPPGDAVRLAQRIVELRDNPALHARLAQQARAKVEAQFDFRRMLDEMESNLAAVCHHQQSAGCAVGAKPQPAQSTNGGA